MYLGKTSVATHNTKNRIYRIQFSSVAQSSPTLCDSKHTRPPCPSPTPGAYSNSCPSTQWYHPTISSSACPLLLLPSIFPSIKVFSNESALHIRWPKYWSFSISHSNDYSGLISFRIDWFDLLAVQGTLKSLLQKHHSSEASILQHSAFVIYSLTLTSVHDYWKNHSFGYTDLYQQSDVSAF